MTSRQYGNCSPIINWPETGYEWTSFCVPDRCLKPRA